MTINKTTRRIMLFRKDLRLSDNAALHSACDQGEVLPIFIHHEESTSKEQDNAFSIGGASQWWLHHSLIHLKDTLTKSKQSLFFFKANHESDITKILERLCKDNHCSEIYWNRRYEPHHIQADTQLKLSLKEKNIRVYSFNNNLLSEPWQQMNKQGNPYKVFTPYWRHCKNRFLSENTIAEPLPIPVFESQTIPWVTAQNCDINDLQLLPKKPNWAANFTNFWQPGESHAMQKWDEFLSSTIEQYEDARDIPSVTGTSKLSPHLAFGEISVRQIWHDVMQHKILSSLSHQALDRYLSEIGWREFSYYQLFHFPKLPTQNFNSRFDAFAWESDEKKLKAWQQGLTGYPLIDAGMRELWQTGYMHNRVRMVVASFLCKDLLINWQSGANWFWDTLLDADLASNSASWQWCAGCGADAAPFFRIFNPVTQSEKFDPEAIYIKRWVPEIQKLPNKWIHKPWETPSEILEQTSIKLGKNYPKPIIDHKIARLEALERYKHLKTTGK